MSDYDTEEENEEFDADNSSTPEVSIDLLIAVDCDEKMFEPNENLNGFSGFQMVLNALYKICDALVLNGTTRNKIAIVFRHEDQAVREFMTFLTPFWEGFSNLRKLTTKNLDFFKSEYLDQNVYPLSSFLNESKTLFKSGRQNNMKHFYFITRQENPYGDDLKEKMQILQEFESLKLLGIQFDLLTLDEEFDYGPLYTEAFQMMDIPKPKFYYNEEFIILKVEDELQRKRTSRYLKLSSASDPTFKLDCQVSNFTYNEKLPTVEVTRSGEAEVKTIRDYQETFDFSMKINDQIYNFSKVEKSMLYQCGVEMGITIIHATKETFSKLGEYLKSPQSLCAKNINDEKFNALWEVCVAEKYNLICYVKYTVNGRVYYAELQPKLINRERQFVIYFMPQTVDSNKIKIKTENPPPPIFAEEKELSYLIADFIDRTTICDYDIAKIKPYDFGKKMEYMKSQLLGVDYKREEIDLLNNPLYSEDPKEVINEIVGLYPEEEPKRKGKKEPAASKRRKT